ncbi:hypothetical protein KCP69_20805 [Salmonella enterica subsp. enterica]|nr:hypothetical protein KCP69_20805 [Salmonella enterica subsp. enterica]
MLQRNLRGGRGEAESSCNDPPSWRSAGENLFRQHPYGLPPLAQLAESYADFNHWSQVRIPHDPPIYKVVTGRERSDKYASNARRARRSRVILHDPSGMTKQ